jgi:nucleotide-binding universal stress UspA family protein
MYHQILLAVALQQWDEFSPHAVAAREAAVALAHGSGAQLTVLSVYDYDNETPEALSLSPESLSLSSVERARDRDTQMVQVDELMATKMQAFLASTPTHEPPITPLLQTWPRHPLPIWGVKPAREPLASSSHGNRYEGLRK